MVIKYDLYFKFPQIFAHMYKYVLNIVVKISVMFAKYFKYYYYTTPLYLRGCFLWTRCMFDVSAVLLQKAFEMMSPFTDD